MKYNNGPASEHALNEFLAKKNKLPQHYWVSPHGLAFNVATIPINPGKKRNGKKRYKYLGYTFDDKFPKKLHNGRIIYEDRKAKLPVTSKN